MMFTIISLLTFSCAILAQSCDPTACLCRLSIDGNVLQGVIPAGTGTIQSEMLIVYQSGSNNTDEIYYCSVTLDRGQGCCDQFTLTAGPFGSGCQQGTGVLACGEQIPYTLPYLLTSTLTAVAFTITGASTETGNFTTIPATLTNNSTTTTEVAAEVSITTTITSYSNNFQRRQLSSLSDSFSVPVGVSVVFAYVTVPTFVTVTSDATSYSTTDVASTTFTITSAGTTIIVATATAIVDEKYTREYGPEDGCAYIPSPFIDQTYYDVNTSIPLDQQVELCAQFCNTTPGCVSFGSNYFPPCKGNTAGVYCIISANSYSGSGEMECGIGTAYDGCLIYQQGTVYQK